MRLLFASAFPLMGVVSLTPTGLGSGSPALYVTHDFLTYTPIAMPVLPATAGNAGGAFVSQVSFPTGTVGWAVDVVPGNGVFLFETTDGGQQWNYVREVHGESNGAWGWVRFVNTTVGWVAAGDTGANGPATLLRTDDGGRSWQTLPGGPNTGMSTPPNFVNATVGFVHAQGNYGRTNLLMTTDGGATWSPVVVPVSAAASGTLLYGLPELSGSRGALPFIVAPQPSEVTSIEQPLLTVGFDTTSDGGRTWTAGPTLPATAVTGIWPVRSTAGRIAAGPAGAAATPTDWWVVSAKTTGKITVQVTNDAGSSWASEPGNGLPTIHVPSDLRHQVNTPLVLQAVTPRVAFLTVETSPSGWSSYVTTDGGASWSMLTPANAAMLPATRELVTPVVRVSPSTGLVEGKTVKVSISGFGAHSRYHVSECASDVDVTEAGCGRGLTTQPTVATNGSGRGSASFVISSSAASSSNTTTTTTRCTHKCVLVVSGGLGRGIAYVGLAFKG